MAARRVLPPPLPGGPIVPQAGHLLPAPTPCRRRRAEGLAAPCPAVPPCRAAPSRPAEAARSRGPVAQPPFGARRRMRAPAPWRPWARRGGCGGPAAGGSRCGRPRGSLVRQQPPGSPAGRGPGRAGRREGRGLPRRGGAGGAPRGGWALPPPRWGARGAQRAGGSRQPLPLLLRPCLEPAPAFGGIYWALICGCAGSRGLCGS